MIACKNCEFEVKNSMRHSLVKNCCPCCGAALLGDVYMRRMEILKQKLLRQEFSHELNKDLVFDITLFMLTEFFPQKAGVVQGDESSEEELDELGSILDEDVREEEYVAIRDEIRGEVLSGFDEELEGSDTDLKVARLKRIAKEKPIRGTGPAVRRVTD